MKQFLVHVVCDWQDWVEAETEEEAIDQVYEDLDMIDHDIYVEDISNDDDDED